MLRLRVTTLVITVLTDPLLLMIFGVAMATRL